MTSREVVIAGGVLAALMALVPALGVVLSIVQGGYRPTVQYVGLLVLLVGFAVAAVTYGSDDVSPRATVDGTGTTIRPDRAVDVPLQVAFFGLAVNIFSVVVLPLGEGLPMWLSVGLRSVQALVGFAILVPLVWGQVRWGASRYLRLTSDGVELGEGLRPKSVGWEQVRSVTSNPPGARWPTPASVVLTTSDEKALRTTTDRFTTNVATLRDLVEFYWRHPEARGELTDGSAIQRLEATSRISR